MKKIMVSLVALFLAGCAAPQPAGTSVSSTYCDPGNCAKMWQASQAWVAQNSGYKIQLATDSVIQTYGPFDFKGLAFRITKMPVSTEAERKAGHDSEIQIMASCDRHAACVKAENAAISDYLLMLDGIRKAG